MERYQQVGGKSRNRPRSVVRRRTLIAALVGAAVFAAPRVGQTRPGGGHTYHRSSFTRSRSHSSSWHHSYSSGSSYHYHSSTGYTGSGGTGCGGNDLAAVLLLVPVILIILVVSVVMNAKYGSRDSWDSGQDAPWDAWAPPEEPPPPAGPVDLSWIRKHDPYFSQVVLEDFLAELYAQAQRARASTQTLDKLSSYLSQQARNTLRLRGGRQPAEVSNVVVGSLRILKGWQMADSTGRPIARIEVSYEANYTEKQLDGTEQDYFVRETWHLSRKLDAKSRPPDQVSNLNCPSCGGPIEEPNQRVCAYCGKPLGSNEYDWFAEDVQLHEEAKIPPRLTGDVEERGTNLPTIYHPNLQQNLAALKAKDPAFDFDNLRQRIQLIFDELQVAWSNLEWERARPFVSDRLYNSNLYWIQAYEKQGLRNITAQTRITSIQLVKVLTDPYYDSVTVRLFAEGLDYTVEERTGKVVSGSKDRPRSYSEYWTLIRQVQAKGPAKTDKSCPNCGAPLQINTAGYCEYCGSKVTGGEFDWVLSVIQQDDSYAG